MSVNASAQVSVNSVKTPFSTDLNATSERATAAVMSSRSDSHIELTSAITQLLKAGSSVKTQMNFFILTGSS